MTNVGIYLVTETSTGLPYIGQSRGLKKRERQHRTGQFPAAAFSFEVLLHCAADPVVLNFLERALVLGYDSYANGFNRTSGGSSGCEVSDETKAKLRRPKSEEHKAKIGAGNRGKSRSEETREKIAATKRGVPRSPEAREKTAAANRGQLRSVEMKEKMSAAQRGKPKSEDTKVKIAAALRGKTLCDETRAKMSAAHKERWARKHAEKGVTDGTH